jgi:hypothetical protein
MKVRLYRGPADGKVYWIPDSQNEIVIEHLRKPKKKKKVVFDNSYLTPGNNTWSTTYSTNITVTNSGVFNSNGPVFVTPLNDDSSIPLDTEKLVYRKTRHTHPDGSIFFEWDKPRRKQ